MHKLKNILPLLLLICSSAFYVGCDDYDDSGLKNEIALVKEDLLALKKQISTVEALVDALNQGKFITEVSEDASSRTIVLTLNDNSKLEVVKRNLPDSYIGVKEVDGVYYWTINNGDKVDFIYSGQGDKIEVSNHGVDTSGLSLDSDGFWTLRGARVVDGNNDFIQISTNKDESLFQEITELDDEVVFVLSDGSKLIIPKQDNPYFKIEGVGAGEVLLFRKGESKELTYRIHPDVKYLEVKSNPQGWSTQINSTTQTLQITAPNSLSDQDQEFLKIETIDRKGLVSITRVSVGLKFPYNDPYATLVLNEGNMTTENGSLIYIDRKGAIYDYVFKTVNNRELGNVTQDLFIYEDLLFIISQNGKKNPVGTEFDNDGKLTVANAETLEGVASFDDELSSLSWPTHLAVLDKEHIYIRDNNGVHLFNLNSKNVQLIANTRGADKNRMAVSAGKVFVPAGKKILVFDKAQALTVAYTLNLDEKVTGVLRCDEESIWVSTVGKVSKIHKISSETYETIKVNEVNLGSVSNGPASTPGITAIGNILYYSGAGTKIHSHNFDTGESKFLIDAKSVVENAGIVYNTIAVHPLTGRLYLNTIKAFGWDFLINHISVFNFEGETPVLEQNYKDHTHFPAGVFFPASFLK